jgi:hypothetical protein
MPDLKQLTQRSFGKLQLATVRESPAWLNILLYGDPGAGKTVLAGSASEIEAMSPVLVGDCEGGTYSLRSFYPEVDVVRLTTTADVVEFYNTLRLGEHGYRTVILDSLTEIQKMVMSDIMKMVIEQDADRDPDVPSIREWGKSGEQMRRIIRRFRDLPMHTIFTALLDEDKDPKGRVKRYPMLPGKLKKEAAGFMDIVLFVYAKHVRLDETGQISNEAEEALHRFVLSSSTDEYTCKDRSARLPEVLLDPTMKKLHEIIQGE